MSLPDGGLDGILLHFLHFIHLSDHACQYPLPLVSIRLVRRVELKIIWEQPCMGDESLSNSSLLHIYWHWGSIHCCIEKQKIEIYLKQTEIKLCSVVGYYRFLLFDLSRKLIFRVFSQWVKYSWIMINYDNTYNPSF